MSKFGRNSLIFWKSSGWTFWPLPMTQFSELDTWLASRWGTEMAHPVHTAKNCSTLLHFHFVSFSLNLPTHPLNSLVHKKDPRKSNNWPCLLLGLETSHYNSSLCFLGWRGFFSCLLRQTGSTVSIYVNTSNYDSANYTISAVGDCLYKRLATFQVTVVLCQAGLKFSLINVMD